jgi:hypothetical protein
MYYSFLLKSGNKLWLQQHEPVNCRGRLKPKMKVSTFIVNFEEISKLSNDLKLPYGIIH